MKHYTKLFLCTCFIFLATFTKFAMPTYAAEAGSDYWKNYAVQKSADGLIASAQKNGKTTTIKSPYSGGAKGVLRKALSPKGKGATALISGIIYGLGLGVDYVMNPDNNSVTIKNFTGTYRINGSPVDGVNISNAASKFFEVSSQTSSTFRLYKGGQCKYVHNSYDIVCLYTHTLWAESDYSRYTLIYLGGFKEETLSSDQIADMVAEAAASGQTWAQEAIASAVQEAAEAGELDTYFDAAAVGEAVDGLTWTGAATGDVVGVETGSTTAPETTTPKTDAKPFEMPVFCKWATTVCNFIDWIKDEPPAEKEPTKPSNDSLSDLGINDTRFQSRVNFNGSCPSRNFEFSLRKHNIVKPIPYHLFCDWLNQISFWLVAFTYLGTGYFVVKNL